jgi:hemolysin activation/secretion protein
MLTARQSSIEIIDDVFDGLGIRDDQENYSIGCRQSFFVDDGDELAYAMSVDFKRASSSLFGQELSFSIGADDGETRVSALRLGSEWHRWQMDQVFWCQVCCFRWLKDVGCHAVNVAIRQIVNLSAG